MICRDFLLHNCCCLVLWFSVLNISNLKYHHNRLPSEGVTFKENPRIARPNAYGALVVRGTEVVVKTRHNAAKIPVPSINT
jgi:hypothetical protein